VTGVTNRLLRVDLSSGHRAVEEIDSRAADGFLGGRGLAAHIVAAEVGPEGDALGSENKIVLVAGLLTGTGAVAGSHWCVAARSPLGGVACSVLGGHFGAELKFAGYDAVVIEGQSADPCYLDIRDDVARVVSALHLWGRTTHQTEEMIRAEAGDAWKGRETRVVSIGPAGEKLASVATVVADGFRFGLGDGLAAVMASKKLKAIAVRGTSALRVADGEALRDAISRTIDRVKRSSLVTDVIWPRGTASLIDAASARGILGTRHFQNGVFQGGEALGGQAIADTIFRRGLGCFGCAIACGRLTEVRTDDSLVMGEGPEHAALAALGSCCGVSDLGSVTRASYFCAEQGIDPVAAGSAIACAMELAERGLIPEDDLRSGLEFGDAEAVLLMLSRIAQRRRFGEVLADGAAALAERYGQPELFMGVKRRAAAAYDPRGHQALGLWYATSSYGPGRIEGSPLVKDLLRNGNEFASTDGKPAQVVEGQNLEAFLDSVGICPLATLVLPLDDILRVANAATGLDLSPESAHRIGERVVNLERRFNLECGIGEDSLPSRWTEEPMPEGPAKGQVCSLARMLPEYFDLRGWDATGVPTAEKLAELGL
jgi:aldehyde:ferredoxin oxidoreductase